MKLEHVYLFFPQGQSPHRCKYYDADHLQGTLTPRVVASSQEIAPLTELHPCIAGPKPVLGAVSGLCKVEPLMESIPSARVQLKSLETFRIAERPLRLCGSQRRGRCQRSPGHGRVLGLLCRVVHSTWGLWVPGLHVTEEEGPHLSSSYWAHPASCHPHGRKSWGLGSGEVVHGRVSCGSVDGVLPVSLLAWVSPPAAEFQCQSFGSCQLL